MFKTLAISCLLGLTLAGCTSTGPVHGTVAVVVPVGYRCYDEFGDVWIDQYPCDYYGYHRYYRSNPPLHPKVKIGVGVIIK